MWVQRIQSISNAYFIRLFLLGMTLFGERQNSFTLCNAKGFADQAMLLMNKLV